MRQQEWESGKSVVRGFPNWFHVAFSDSETEGVGIDGIERKNKLIITINRKAVKDEDNGTNYFKVILYDDASGGVLGGRQYTIPFDLRVLQNEHEGLF